MTDILPDEISSSLKDGLRFLRSSALSAHAAGDGFVVNHICRVAIRAIFRALGDSTGPVPIDLDDVRWVFCLWLHWLLDYELVIEASGRHSLHGLLERMPKSRYSQHDFVVLSNLFSFLADPLSPFPASSFLELPDDWFEHRSEEPEDIALLSLSTEFAWYSNNNSAGVPWHNLVDNWLTKCPQGAPLATALKTLRRRLALQTELCQGVRQQVSSGIDGSASSNPFALFEQCWQAFLECEWENLDALIKELSSKTRVDASEYLPLFNLLHASRPFRPETDDQTVSLSRRFYGMSRQPAQVFHGFRAHNNTVNALHLKLQSDPHPGAIDLWKCLVLSMLEQLSALRSWDFGRWLQAIAQQGDYHLELARFGNADHAKRGVMCCVLSLRDPQKGKDSSYDDAILLLDHLTEEVRSELIRWLLARRPVEWRGAHRVLRELADSIPEDQAVDVARWTVQLSLSQ